MDTRLEIVLAAKDITGTAFKKVQNRIKRLSKAMFSLQGAMVGVAGAAGIGLFIKKNLEAADSIAKIADSVGVSTKSLQEYRFVAERSGVATAQLDQGLGAFSKRLGELKAGTGALNTYLNKNNEALKEQLIATNSTDEALNLFLSSLAKIENQSEKTALSAAAFSRTAGIKMTNMVKGGTQSLAGLRREFSELGLEINEKWLRQSEKAIDQFTNLEYAIKSRLMGAVVVAAPQITKIVEDMTEWVIVNDDFLEQKIPGYVDSIGDSISDMGTSIKTFVNSKEFGMIKEYWEIIAGAYVGSKFGPLGALVGAGGGGYYSAYKDLKDLMGNNRSSAASLHLYDIPARVGSPGNPDTLNISKTGSPIKPFMFYEDTYRDFTKELSDMEQYFRDSAIEADLDSFFSDLEPKMEETTSAWENAFDGWAAGFSGTLTDMVWGAESSFKEIATSFGKMVTQMVIQQSIVQPMVSGFTGLFSAQGNAFGSSGVMAYAQGGTFTNSIVNRPTMFAHGGGFGMMGEAGPEAILPLTRTSSGDLGVKTDNGKAIDIKFEVIDNTGSNTKVTPQQPRFDGAKYIMGVVLDSAQRNVGGFKNNLAGILSN